MIFLTASWVAVSRMMGVDEKHPTHPCRVCVQQVTIIESTGRKTKGVMGADVFHGLPYSRISASKRTVDRYTERASLIRLARMPEMASIVKGFLHVSPFLNLNSLHAVPNLLSRPHIRPQLLCLSTLVQDTGLWER